MIEIFTSRYMSMTCGNRKFPESAQNRVHFPEYGAFRVHRQLDIVASTDRPSDTEGRSVFCWRTASTGVAPEAVP